MGRQRAATAGALPTKGRDPGPPKPKPTATVVSDDEKSSSQPKVGKLARSQSGEAKRSSASSNSKSKSKSKSKSSANENALQKQLFAKKLNQRERSSTYTNKTGSAEMPLPNAGTSPARMRSSTGSAAFRDMTTTERLESVAEVETMADAKEMLSSMSEKDKKRALKKAAKDEKERKKALEKTRKRSASDSSPVLSRAKAGNKKHLAIKVSEHSKLDPKFDSNDSSGGSPTRSAKHHRDEPRFVDSVDDLCASDRALLKEAKISAKDGDEHLLYLLFSLQTVTKKMYTLSPRLIEQRKRAPGYEERKEKVRAYKEFKQNMFESVLFSPGNPTKIYKHLRREGAGGFGKVYCARQVKYAESPMVNGALETEVEGGGGGKKGNDKGKKKEKPAAFVKRTVAVKKVPMVSLRDRQRALDEVAALSLCSHSNVVQFYGAYDLSHEIWIVMEYCEGGSLGRAVGNHNFVESSIARIARDCLRALEFLHSQNVVHRDIKSDNIVLGFDGQIKLIDFGLAVRLPQPEPFLYTMVGTTLYMSPEMCRREVYGTKTDIFSLGVVILEMADGRVQFPSKLGALFYHAIGKSGEGSGNGPFLKNSKWSSEFRDFVAKMVEPDPDKRPTATELLKHPFLENVMPAGEFETVIKSIFIQKVCDQFLNIL